MFCTPQCLVDCFGTEEIICLTDRENPKTCEINNVVAQNAIDKACAFILNRLSCCGFDVKEIKQKIENLEDGVSPGVLKLWCVNVTRYFLYDSILLNDKNGSDHESYRRYMQAIEEMDACCKSGRLLIDCEVCVKETTCCFAVANEETCLPIDFPCCNTCGCQDCMCDSKKKLKEVEILK